MGKEGGTGKTLLHAVSSNKPQKSRKNLMLNSEEYIYFSLKLRIKKLFITAQAFGGEPRIWTNGPNSATFSISLGSYCYSTNNYANELILFRFLPKYNGQMLSKI
jgi:hypothetical protein